MEQNNTLEEVQIQLDLMKKNVYDLQKQVQHSYIRIDELIKEKTKLEEDIEHLRNKYQPTEGC